MKSLSVAVVALSLLLGSVVWAQGIMPPSPKLGYGFATGLVAGKDFVANQLIVSYLGKGKAAGLTMAAQALGGRVVKEIQGSAMLLSFGSERGVQAAISQLAARPDVVVVERNGFMWIPPSPQLSDLAELRAQKMGVKGAVGPTDIGMQAVSNDPGTGFQYHLTVIRKTAALPALATTPPTVAVIDTGVDYTHPDLTGVNKVILGLNTVANNFDPFDDNGHGTHVAGIIAANARNNFYGEGVCSNCKILAVKVVGAGGSGTFFDVAQGMAYARTAVMPTGVPAVKVINMSLGGSASAVIAAQVDAIKAAGKVLVAAAGNENNDPDQGYPSYPGADPDTALRVMATEQNDCRAWFSNFSPATAPNQYNIAAPGWQIPSTVPDLGYANFSGTSMASPVVAGAAALVWGQLPTLTRDQLVTRLVSNGKLINCGFAAATRRVDVRKAITGVSETAVVGRLQDPFTGKAPNPITSPANARLFNGAAQVAIDVTNRGGSYEMTGLTTGARILKGDRAAAPAYVNARLRNLSIAAGLVDGPYTDALPKARPMGNATITLDWKNIQPIFDTTGCTSTCNGWEFDLWIKLPDGNYVGPYDDPNDLFYNPGDLVASPFVKSGRDSLNDLESTESVVIGRSAANGVYRIFVDNLFTGASAFNDSWTGSLASVQLYNGAASIGTFYANPPGTCGTKERWYVGNLTKNGNNYAWANVNTCSNTRP